MSKIQPFGAGRTVVAGSPARIGLGRRLIGWAAAYAFVLHALFAGILATQIAAANPAAAAYELCLTGPDGGTLPGHSKIQHENCALHCATSTGGVPLLALAVLALLLFPPRAVVRFVQFVVPSRPEYLCRAGQSRAPPLPA